MDIVSISYDNKRLFLFSECPHLGKASPPYVKKKKRRLSLDVRQSNIFKL